jgi:hypothetical protein
MSAFTQSGHSNIAEIANMTGRFRPGADMTTRFGTGSIRAVEAAYVITMTHSGVGTYRQIAFDDRRHPANT